MSANGNGYSHVPLQRDSSCMSELKSSARCLKMHLNSLWSIWYGIVIASLNGYIALVCSNRFFDYVDQFNSTDTSSQVESHICIGLTGFAILLIPFFFATSLFKVGNLANDGFKLGRNLSSCTANSLSGITFGNGSGGCQRMWQHCGPTSALLHLVIAFSFLIPKMIIEAQLIHTRTVPLSKIWKTDMDFIIPHSYIALNLSVVPENSPVLNELPKPLPLSVNPGLEMFLTDNTSSSSVSIEFLNYALALFIYSIRYPSVFWNTNKYFGILFSLQLFINSFQCLLLHAGVCVLYKVHVVGTNEAVPLLSVRASKWAMKFGTPLILNKEVTIVLYMMSVLLILVSSLVLYLYGYGRLNSFLNRERARRIISMKGGHGGRTWGYFTHCAALCILVAIGICEAPLLYDFTIIYRGSLDLLVLVAILSSILHLFIWVLLWLVLTLKQHWQFKLQVTVGHSTVRSANSIRIITDVQLAAVTHDYTNTPLLVVGHGRTYTISEVNSKKAIMTVIQKASMEKKLKCGQGGNKAASGAATSDDGDEQIYWLRPKSRTPRHSPDSSSSETRVAGLFSKACRSSSNSSSSRRKNENLSVEEMAMLPTTKRNKDGMGAGCDGADTGDYVLLREVTCGETSGKSSAPVKGTGHHTHHTLHTRHTASQHNQQLTDCVQTDRVTYACVNKELLNPIMRDYEDPSPLLTPEPHDNDDLPPPPPELSVGYNHCNGIPEHKNLQSTQRPLQRVDSGMPSEEIPSRSDSEVSGGSPPDRNSETSSGVHSNSSRDSEPNKCLDSSLRNVAPYSSFFNGEPQKIHPQQWIQKNIVHSPPPYNNPHVYKPQQHYAVASKTPVITEVVEEGGTVVIRRKSSCNGLTSPLSPPNGACDRFSRSTNMRLTSFSDNPPEPALSKISSTLPHYPTTQPTGAAYPQCATMPLPISSGVVPGPSESADGHLINGSGGGTGSCGSFPRSHTTIPTYHNGIRLCSPAPLLTQTQNPPYAKFHFPLPHCYPANVNDQSINPRLLPTCVLKASHHTFPQLPQLPIHLTSLKLQNCQKNSQRDSANFSQSSSGGEADICNGRKIVS